MGFWPVVIASIALVFLWGLISPRSQWKVLAAWSYRDPNADEPSAVAFGIQRALSAVGVIFFGAVGAAGIADYIAALPPPQPPLTVLQQMWGESPLPQVVDRIVLPSSIPPEGLVEVPISGYQVVDNVEHRPRYLHLLGQFEPGGTLSDRGLIGVPPSKEFSALDSAELVVNVRGWADCIPREAVIVETETTVQIAVYYGVLDSANGAVPAAAQCVRAPFVQNSLLLPINLAAPLDDRELQSLDGTPLREVPEIRK